MKKNNIILSFSIIGVICILVNVYNRNIFDGHFTTLGIVFIAISFFYRRFTSNERPVYTRGENNDLVSTTAKVKNVIMLALFIFILFLMGFLYYLKNR